MKRFIVASFLAVPLIAQTPPPPTITAVEPSVGPSTGGTFVTIIGTNLGTPEGFACLLPCPPIVRFGAAEVDATEQSRNVLVVRTPKHAPGTVDVSVRTPDGRTVSAQNAFTFSPFEESGSERLLLPVYLDGTVPGNNGSLWSTEFWIRNHGKTIVTLAQWPCESQICLPVFPLTRTLLPGETLRNLPAFFRPPTNNTGRILHLFVPGTVSTNLRVFDRSRGDTDAGTQLPVVRERELLTTTAHLMSIPISPRFRLTLRIYEVTPIESQFTVRIYSQTEGTADSSLLATLELTARTIGSETGQYAVFPAYADYGAFQIPPQPSGFVRFELEPLTPGARFWTFVSVTNNDTQRVTLVTP